jgi:hypothetical protein
LAKKSQVSGGLGRKPPRAVTRVSVGGEVVWEGQLDLAAVWEDLRAALELPANRLDVGSQHGINGGELQRVVDEARAKMHSRSSGRGESDVAPAWSAGTSPPSFALVAIAVLEFLARTGGPSSAIQILVST